MKKILALLIVLTLVVSTFASCDLPDLPFFSNDTDEPADNDNQDNNNDVNDDTQNTLLEDAKNVLRDLYKEKLTTTAVDYSVVSQVIVDVDVLTVTWSVNNENIIIGEPDAETKTVLIQVPAQSIETIEYVLTATITAADGSSAQISFNATVPMFEVDSHADYMAAVKDDVLTIMGVVVAINSVTLGNKYNHLFLADTSVDGGYYCYKVSQDPEELGVKVGMTVSVTGKMSPYSGMQEIIEGQISILDTEIKTVDALDITNAFAAGADLGAYVGLPVSIKGVTIGAQDLEKDTSQYLYFSIGEEQGYVRTYITDFPTHMQADRDNIKATIDADHAAHFGYKADVEGILVLYSGNPYLIPMSVTPFTNYQEVEKTPAEKVAAEIGELKLNASFSADAVIDLLLKGKYYEDVTFTWATSDATNAAIADGKLTLKVPNETTTVTITVTVACGEATQTKEFTIKLSKSITTITDALAIGAAKEHNTYTEEKYIVAGIIKEVYNTTYGNMYLVDELGNTFTVYGTYSADGANRYDAMEAKPVAGDYVVIIGILGQYNGTAQMKNGWIQSFTTPITIPQANELGNTFEKNQYTEDKKVITGEITEVQNTTYGNVVIKDAEGNSILVYGLYSANGVVRYDAMATKPAVGDTITVLGIIGMYNAPQMKNGWLIGYTAGAGETPDTHEHVFVDGKCECGETDPNYQPPTHEHADTNNDFKCDDTTCGELMLPEDGSTLTIAQALAIGALTTTTQKYYVTGMITSVYNTQYGNMYITDGTDTIIVYGLYYNGSRYDAMTVKPVAFDTITVYGILTSYNGVGQFKNADLTNHVPHTECTEFTQATCKKLAACVVCGKETGELAAHTMVEGVCSVCGHIEGAAAVVTDKATLTYTTATTTNMTGKNDAAKLGLDESIFSVIGNKGGTNNNCGLNKAGQIRLYGSSANGNGSYFTVTSAEGYTIQSIKITFTNTTNNKNCQLTINGASTVFDGSSTTWEVDVNSNSFELKNVVKGSTTQIYIKSIEITYVVPSAQ